VTEIVLNQKIRDSKFKLTIGLDASNLWVGGARTHLLALLNQWDHLSEYFDKVIIWGGKDTLSAIPNKKWIIKQKSPEFRSFKRYWWQTFAFDKELTFTKCHVLFSPGGRLPITSKPSITMYRNSLPFEIKEAWRYGFSIFFFKLIILRFLLINSFKRAHSVIFLSKYGMEQITKKNYNLKKKSVLIPHGVDLNFQDLSRLRNLNSLENKKTPIRVVYVSTIDVFKHQWIVIKALAYLRDLLGLNLQLTLIGGSYPKALFKMKNSLKKYDPQGLWVDYLGLIPHSKIAKIYHDADLGLFASSCENLPNILLEMMASGLPIACSNRGPMPEVLKNGGTYFNPENSNSIASAVTLLLKSHKLRNSLARKAQAEAMKYSWKVTATETLKVIVSSFVENKGEQ
jgi:glycosyltransferase involved in cell wall biosynthesis